MVNFDLKRKYVLPDSESRKWTDLLIDGLLEEKEGKSSLGLAYAGIDRFAN